MIGFPKKFTDAEECFRFRQKHIPLSRELGPFLEKQALRHDKQGWPDKKTEGWERFPFQKIRKGNYTLLEDERFPKSETDHGVSFDPSSLVVRVPNGAPIRFPNQNGLSVFSWKDVIEGKSVLSPEVKEFVFQSLKREREGLCPLNSALSLNGLVIVVEKPWDRAVEIQYSCPSVKGGNPALNLRNFVFIRDQAKARIIEVFHGNESGSSVLLNTQMDCFAGTGADLEWIRLDRGGERDVFLNHLFCELSDSATARFFTLSLSGGVSRWLTGLFQKRKSVSEIKGLSVLGGRRHTEHKVIASHQEAGGESRQLYRSLLFQSACHVFNGMIQISKSAQKTSAFQLNRNLILGDKALAVSCPKLDIKADDVKAHHGAVTSSLEESRSLLFYLQSRGMNAEQALELILSALVKESFSSLNPTIRPLLESLVFDHLSVLQSSGVS